MATKNHGVATPTPPASKPMTREAVNRIKSSEAIKNNGHIDKGSFPARAERALTKSKKR